jgi:uncharacterized protein (DUF58 family)
MASAPPGQARLKIDPALLQRLKGIELKSRFLVRGLYSNRHRTADHGLSTEFVEHRQYRRGDDLRSIDWRVLARTDRLYVKVHEMESNMRVHLVLDTSASMRVPPPAGLPSKLELAATIVGAVAMMVESQQDSVGLLCVGSQIDEYIPARQGKAQLQLVYQHLNQPRGDGAGRFGDLVREAGERLGSRGMVLLVTDALDDPAALLAALKHLAVRRQDVTLIQVLDRNELEFPFDRLTEFRHPETGQRIVGNPGALRAKYLERLQAHLDQVRDACRRARADYLRLDNGDDLSRLLALHFVRRALGGGR